ncbi:uncharacterized protein PAC_04501 [Phialocephala subalpina]|uniref:Uncharacterized protein n=1 Tax=Phialocephala subalpina TaxID=576137 RepID=A0A1L7WPC2_9HELO|nr:uncharacterized protein PAC_04501 [Phialocephala subalpina]
MSGFGFHGSYAGSGKKFASPYKLPQQGEAEVLLNPLKTRPEKQSKKSPFWDKVQGKSENHLCTEHGGCKDRKELKKQKEFLKQEEELSQAEGEAAQKACRKEKKAAALARDQLITNATLQRLTICAQADKKFSNFRHRVLREMDLMAGESLWRSRLRDLDGVQARDMLYPENKRRHEQVKVVLCREVLRKGGLAGKCGIHGIGGREERDWEESGECFCVVFEFKRWGEKGQVEKRVLNYCEGW